MNIIKNVNSSNLPTNIKNAHQIFENPVIFSKLKAGPIDPKAGPTLPNDAADPPIDDIKSKPWVLKTPAPTINNIRYSMKNAKIFTTTSFFTTEWLYLSGKIAFGCNDLLNSRKPFLIRIRCLEILIPPEVDPDEAPINISPKNNIVKNGVQAAKSPVTKPVVVIIATTWKRACLKLASNLPRTWGWLKLVESKSTLEFRIIVVIKTKDAIRPKNQMNSVL